MHRLSRLSVYNFRSIQACEVELSDLTALIGYNNAGKSNLLSAVVWALRPYALDPRDFHDPKAAVWAEGEVSGLTAEVLALLSEDHRKRMAPLVKDGVLRFRREQATPGGGKAAVVLSARDPSVVNDDDDNAWKRNPTGIDQAVQALFPEPIHIEAMQDAAEDAAKFKATTTIGKLIGELVQPVKQSQQAVFEAAWADLRAKLDVDGSDRPADMQKFDSEATAAVDEFFPGVNVRLHIPIPGVDELFRGGTIRVQEGAGKWSEITTLGHGAQRSIQMALVRVLAERQGKGATPATRSLLLIDEPELYLHPSGIERVRQALTILSAGRYQVVVSTHSPLMIDGSDIEGAVLVRKDPKSGTRVRKTLRAAAAAAIAAGAAQAQALYSLSQSSQWLFADRVIIAEGTTEKRLVPHLLRHGCSKTLASTRTALVDLGGVDGIVKATSILTALDVPWRALVDLDFAFRKAVDAGWLVANAAEMDALRAILLRLEAGGKVKLANGLPTGKDAPVSASEAYSMLAAEPDAASHLTSIHAALRGRGVWLWTRGCVEDHLGISGKREQHWSAFALRLSNEGFDSVVLDAEGVREALTWLVGG